MVARLTFPRRSFVRLGALGGDELVRANTIINALNNRHSLLQRDVAEAVTRGEVSGALLGEVDAISDEIDALGAQVFEIDTPDLAPWIRWSNDIAQRIGALETRHAVQIQNSRRIRTTRIGVGFLTVFALAGAGAYVVYRNRRKGRR